MPIKYNNFDIGNAYLGNDNLVAMYQGSNLVWTNGIKLKSLLGKQNVPFVVNNSFTYIQAKKDGSFIGGYTDIANECKTFNTTINHNYFVLAKYSGNMTTLRFYETGYTSNVRTTPIKDNNYFYGIITETKSCIRTSAIVDNLSIGDVLSEMFVIDLTQAKLDTLTAEQVYDLLTLNGTDFTDLELLASGYEIKLGSFKQQTTNSVDLGTLNWYGAYQSGDLYYATSPSIKGIVKNYSPSEIPNIVCNGYTPNGYWFTSRDKDIKIQNDDGTIYIYDTEFVGLTGEQIKQKLTGVKLTYELANKNNIAGSKYGFVKLKDLGWRYETAQQCFYSDTLSKIKKVGFNIFTDKYAIGKKTGNWNIDDMTIQGHSVYPNIYLKDTRYTNATDLVNSFTDNDILIYELANSLGNKLDNYTAEQVYYMFFATLGNSKMYVPNGRKFESAGNVIVGTKYGIVDISTLNWTYYSPTKTFIAYPSGIKTTTGYGIKGNLYIEGYDNINATQSENIPNKSMCQYIDRIWLNDLSYTDTTTFKNSLKGKYLIYELASPNGTDYSDLTAKDIYDLINDDELYILAKGKSIGGVRNLLGVQNVATTLTYNNVKNMVIGQNLNNSFMVAQGVNDSKKPLSIIQNHKYLSCVEIENLNLDYFTFRTWLWNNETNTYNYTDLSKDNNRYYGIINYTNQTGNQIYNNIALTYVDNTTSTIIVKKQVLIDLTENNLQNLTAQEAYQYFKENNLFNLSTTGVINIGGLKK